MEIRKWDGKRIGMPGFIRGIPIELYHSGDLCVGPSISSTGLRKIFLKSPAHYWCTSPYNPDRLEDDDETEALVMGRAVHHLLFGQADFQKIFALRPDTINGETWHGNKNVCKSWLAEKKAKGFTVISPSQMDHIKGMAKSLAADPAVQRGSLNGEIEITMVWLDKETGVYVKARPDAIPTDSLIFNDLKTTPSVMWPDIQRSIRDYAYYMQAALVAEGCTALLSTQIESFWFTFIEKKQPYAIEFVALKDADLIRGIQANRIALRKFADCYKAKNWPGPRGERAEPKFIELSEWDQKRIDDHIKFSNGG
jgi:hypothetical protein